MKITPSTLLPKESCTITDGPSKYDLMASLFDKKTVSFAINTSAVKTTMNIGKIFNGSVHFVGAEDGSGESWYGKLTVKGLPDSIDAGKTEDRVFYYNTRTKKGSIFEASKKLDI